MWEKIKKFIFDKELYVKDTKRIELLHKILQTINIVVLFISLFASLIASIEVFEFDFLEGLVALLASVIVCVLYFALSKVVLGISFGWLYDTRVLRLNYEMIVSNNIHETNENTVTTTNSENTFE